jgi:hypothetical protein
MWKQPVFMHTGGLDDEMLSKFFSKKEIRNKAPFRRIKKTA